MQWSKEKNTPVETNTGSNYHNRGYTKGSGVKIELPSALRGKIGILITTFTWKMLFYMVVILTVGV